jgi:hypothetical protein
MKKYFYLVALICIVFACKDNEKEEILPDPSMTMAEEDKSLTFANEAGEKTITLNVNREVEAVSSEIWCTPTVTSSADKSISLRITVTKNEATKRTAIVTLTTKPAETDDKTTSVAISVEQDAVDEPKITWLIENRSEIEKIGTVDRTSGLPNITGLYISNKPSANYINSVEKFVNMYHATIVKTKNEDYPYFMYFFGWAYADMNPGWPGCDAIFMARGKNLDKWEFYAGETGGIPKWTDKMSPFQWAPIITADESKWYDNWHNGDPSVVYKDDKFFMAYSAYGTDHDMVIGGTMGDISCIMGAESTDGIHWSKSEYPILIWEEEISKNEPLTGDGNYPIGFSDNAYFGLYHRPSVMYDATDKCWKMWFDYISEYRVSGLIRMSMGYAENRGNPMKFADWQVIRAGNTPVITEFANPDVVKINGKYYAYGDPNARYHGAQSEHFGFEGWPLRQCVEAQSDDGINWRVSGFLNPDEDTQANHVPTLYYEDGVLFLFYATQKGNRNESGFKELGHKYFNSATYDYRYFAIRFKARFLNEQILNNVTY